MSYKGAKPDCPSIKAPSGVVCQFVSHSMTALPQSGAFTIVSLSLELNAFMKGRFAAYMRATELENPTLKASFYDKNAAFVHIGGKGYLGREGQRRNVDFAEIREHFVQSLTSFKGKCVVFLKFQTICEVHEYEVIRSGRAHNPR